MLDIGIQKCENFSIPKYINTFNDTYRCLRFATTKLHLLREINNLLKINKVVQNYSKADGEDHLRLSRLPAVRCNVLHSLELVLGV